MPEFEDLAAIQAGFTFRPVVVRREKVAGGAAIRDGRVRFGKLLPDVWTDAGVGPTADGRR